MPGPSILGHLRSRQAEWLGALRHLVEFESPSRDKPSLDRLATRLAEGCRALGGRVERIANPEGGDHLLARFFVEDPGREPTLVLGHYDTVWPLGTLARMPFRTEGNKAFGPGVFDMKASLILADFAIDAIGHLGLRPHRPVDLLLTSDEEIGSPTSRRLIEERARQSARVLVLEPTLPDGSLKTARKGVGHFVVEVEGRPAHAGVEPEKGISAIEELARLVLRLHALGELEGRGLGQRRRGRRAGRPPTWSPPAPRPASTSGPRPSIKPDPSRPPSGRCPPTHPGARLTISGGFNRPPMERTPGGVALYERARDLGRTIGLEPRARARPEAAPTAISRPHWASPRSTAWAAGGPGPTPTMSRSRSTPCPNARRSWPCSCSNRERVPMFEDVQIRPAASVADYLACQKAQRLAWGITDDSYVVPLATMVGANLHGGLVLGAFTPNGEALGLSFAFLGKVEGRPCLYSQLTGVVPGHQGTGLGGKLKHAQRDYARLEGIPRLAWSFDPFQAGNAKFNLDRLGATAARYLPDMYGPRTDALNAGSPTDRLIVEWPVDPEPRTPIEDPSRLPRLLDIRNRPDGTPEPVGLIEQSLREPACLLEIPPAMNSITPRDPALAGTWVRAVRRGFLEAFFAGYRAEGFLREVSPEETRCYYVLARNPKD